MPKNGTLRKKKRLKARRGMDGIATGAAFCAVPAVQAYAGVQLAVPTGTARARCANVARSNDNGGMASGSETSYDVNKEAKVHCNNPTANC